MFPMRQRARPAAASGGSGNETFLAPQLITQAAHVKVDRATGCGAGAEGRRGARLRLDPEPRGAPTGRSPAGVVMGVGLALSEGTQLDDEGRQRNPALLDYKLVTCADAPEIEVDWIQIDDEWTRAHGVPKGWANRRRCRRRPRSPTRSRRCSARQVRQMPMTPERVWAAAHADRIARGRGMTRSFTSADDARGSVSRPSATGARPVAGGTDLVVGVAPGQGAAARGDRRDRPASSRCGAIARDRRRRPPPRRARRPTRRSWRARSSARGSPRSPTRRRSSGRTRPARPARSAATS